MSSFVRGSRWDFSYLVRLVDYFCGLLRQEVILRLCKIVLYTGRFVLRLYLHVRGHDRTLCHRLHLSGQFLKSAYYSYEKYTVLIPSRLSRIFHMFHSNISNIRFLFKITQFPFIRTCTNLFPQLSHSQNSRMFYDTLLVEEDTFSDLNTVSKLELCMKKTWHATKMGTKCIQSEFCRI